MVVEEEAVPSVIVLVQYLQPVVGNQHEEKSFQY